ncbi:MAG: 50S ribosomal protein L19 [uncultured bacterium]|nr:MAG: 50S ribosomal protein L19 [uncultured bacterium]KKP68026.1 MAG: 50S ribosomal protein L19 [Candidatus Moranbacteria bacterium GW2011_GWE1_35_17]KKP68387.1 MAG: 50S ribosomal protein L19 [Candidatus Moranbacteria bacterium GW2011_GWE2_35_164]KKP81726.1 MAG: 50S ribosomal protein L19 [Candidatus Moranbacteria bacterium GW2011_GWF2_35_54]HBR79073.1 50S ribosomal protein L19 [Candidatus Moranbacteria bacterium]
MNKTLTEFNLDQRKSKNYPEFKTGDIVKVHRRIKEGEKERVQIFEGIIIAKKGGQSSSPTITVRKVSSGVGVELVLPVYSPSIDTIEVVKRAKVKRAKLYYIRDKSAKSLRLKYQDIAKFGAVEEIVEEKVSEENEVNNEETKGGDNEGVEKEAVSVEEKSKEDAKEEEKK